MFHEKIFENTGKFYFGSIAGPKTLLKKVIFRRSYILLVLTLYITLTLGEKKNINFSLKT